LKQLVISVYKAKVSNEQGIEQLPESETERSGVGEGVFHSLILDKRVKILKNAENKHELSDGPSSHFYYLYNFFPFFVF
jgi:hypothetical protein